MPRSPCLIRLREHMIFTFIDPLHPPLILPCSCPWIQLLTLPISLCGAISLSSPLSTYYPILLRIYQPSLCSKPTISRLRDHLCPSVMIVAVVEAAVVVIVVAAATVAMTWQGTHEFCTYSCDHLIEHVFDYVHIYTNLCERMTATSGVRTGTAAEKNKVARRTTMYCVRTIDDR